MKAIIENNAIRLVDDFSTVTCNLTIPFGNIQKMKEMTGAKIISVSKTHVNFHNHAGPLARVKFSVRFSKIEKFLNTANVYDCENYEAYISLLGKHGLYYTNLNVPSCDMARLYAFGELYVGSPKPISSIYINKTGRRISLSNRTDKFVNFKGEWFRLETIK